MTRPPNRTTNVRSAGPPRYRRAAAICLMSVFALLGARLHGVDYAYGTSYLEPLKYEADFTHFDWANPDAPKGGHLRAAEMGTFDSFNGILDKGRVAEGVERLGEGALIYDRLLEQAIRRARQLLRQTGRRRVGGRRLQAVRLQDSRRRVLARRHAADRRRRGFHVHDPARQRCCRCADGLAGAGRRSSRSATTRSCSPSSRKPRRTPISCS